MNAKFQGGMSEEGDNASKEADLLAGDVISNYKTVQSYGHLELIIEQYDNYLIQPYKKRIKNAYFMGFFFGFSQFS